MKRIMTRGVTYLEPLRGSARWYWGTDYTGGDLYEAEELWKTGHRIRSNRVIFADRRDGTVWEPVRAEEGQYFGRPAYDGGRIILLLADFPRGEIRLMACDEEGGEAALLAVLPRGAVEDCYNLMPSAPPLLVTRQKGDRFQIVWPEKLDVSISPAESFCCADDERLYFSRWFEDPEYREEVVVRSRATGEVLEQYRGSLNLLPDGQNWVLE